MLSDRGDRELLWQVLRDSQVFRLDGSWRSLDFMFAFVLAKDTMVFTSLCLQVPMHRPRLLTKAVFVLEHTDRRLKVSSLFLSCIRLVGSLQEHWHYLFLENGCTLGQINSHFSQVILIDAWPFLRCFLFKERASLGSILAALAERYGTCQFVVLEKRQFLMGVFFIPRDYMQIFPLILAFRFLHLERVIGVSIARDGSIRKILTERQLPPPCGLPMHLIRITLLDQFVRCAFLIMIDPLQPVYYLILVHLLSISFNNKSYMQRAVIIKNGSCIVEEEEIELRFYCQFYACFL